MGGKPPWNHDPRKRSPHTERWRTDPQEEEPTQESTPGGLKTIQNP
jgi:hypothetical protein